MTEITNEQAEKIINDRYPIGQFYLKEKDKYVGIDNSDGDAWVEEFKTFDELVEWMNELN